MRLSVKLAKLANYQQWPVPNSDSTMTPLWHGLSTVPQTPTESLLKRRETCGRVGWHGQETVPQHEAPVIVK